MIWRKGMKAVCISNKPYWKAVAPTTAPGASVGPAFKEIVTVLRVRSWGDYTVLDLAEYGYVGGYDAAKFRPLTKPSKTLEEDRELFRKIADSPPAKGREVEREYSNPRVGV